MDGITLVMSTFRVIHYFRIDQVAAHEASKHIDTEHSK
jgi:hypothetical protein